MNSVRGPSGAREVHPKFLTLLDIPYEWTTHIYRTRSSNSYRSIVQGGLIGGGTCDRGGRQRCFFSAMHPLGKPLPEVSDVPTNIPKMLPYKHPKRPDLDAVHILDLKIAPDRGFKF